MPPMTVVSPSATSTRRDRALGIDGRNAVDRAAEVRRRVLEEHAHDDGVRRGDLRRDPQRQRRVLEGDGDGIVRHGLNRNLDALRHLGFDVVLRRNARRREQAAAARRLERGQHDVEVERAVHRAERDADGAGGRRRAQVDAGFGRRAARVGPCTLPECGR